MHTFNLLSQAEMRKAAMRDASKRYHASPRGKETSRERSRRRRAKFPEEVLWLSARQRARRTGVEFEILREDIEIPTHCPVLGIPLSRQIGCAGDNSPSLDRFDPKQGYVRGNVAVISNRANRMKNDASADEVAMLLAWMRAIERKG